MNAKISVFVICVEAIIYLLLYNLHDVPLRVTDVWFQDMLEIGCNYSILNHKRINYKICFAFQGVDNTGVFYKTRDKVVPSK